jgi:hypothetical protein
VALKSPAIHPVHVFAEQYTTGYLACGLKSTNHREAIFGGKLRGVDNGHVSESAESVAQGFAREINRPDVQGLVSGEVDDG